MSDWTALTLSNACEGQLEELFREALVEAKGVFQADEYSVDGGKISFGVTLNIRLVHNQATDSIAIEGTCTTKPPKRRPRVGNAALKGGRLWNPPGIQQDLIDRTRTRPTVVEK